MRLHSDIPGRQALIVYLTKVKRPKGEHHTQGSSIYQEQISKKDLSEINVRTYQVLAVLSSLAISYVTWQETEIIAANNE